MWFRQMTAEELWSRVDGGRVKERVHDWMQASGESLRGVWEAATEKARAASRDAAVPEAPAAPPPTKPPALEVPSWYESGNMPDFESVLAPLRCDRLPSFSSCAQHCLSVSPDFGKRLPDQDLTDTMLPQAHISRSWWNRRATNKAPSGLTYAMSTNEQEQFKLCLLDVCVRDYLVPNSFPGCLTKDGYVANTEKVGDRPEIANLDFYSPQRIQMYQRYGVFKLSSFIRGLWPECDLTNPGVGDCHLYSSQRAAVYFTAIALSVLVIFSVLGPWLCGVLAVPRQSKSPLRLGAFLARGGQTVVGYGEYALFGLLARLAPWRTTRNNSEIELRQID